MRCRDAWCLFLLAFVCVYAYYFNFTDNFFSDDDFKYLENMLHGPLSVLLGYGNVRVVSNIAWWPLYAVSGLDPFGYNLFGIVLHSANAVLLVTFLVRLLSDKAFAIVCGAIYLFNAVGSDALFWKASNNSLICTFFCLITLYLYVAHRQAGSNKYFVLSVACYVLAIFSKEDAASMPCLIILIDLLFFSGVKGRRTALAKALPYAVVIVLYLATGKLVFDYALGTSVEHAKFFKLRPLHSLFAGWSVFFLSPQGNLAPDNPAIYLTALGMIASFFWVQNRKLLFLGYGWVFLAFLPQSVTILGQFDPKFMFNSISRYLYLPSIGSAIVLGALVMQTRQRCSRTVHYAVVATFFSLFVLLNYRAVQERGGQWRIHAEPTVRFLEAMKKAIPAFPPDAYIYVANPPNGRAYVQQALRAFYGNPRITWMIAPEPYLQNPQGNAFFVTCNWRDDGSPDLYIVGGH